MAELRYTYLLDVKDMASRQVAQANARIAGSVERTNVAMRQQGTVAEAASRKVQTAGARQAAEWKQVERAARTAERSVAQAATQASASVSRAMERQVAAQRKAGLSYAQIARQQKAAGVSARETAAAIEQSAAREQKAMAGSSRAAKGLGGVASGFKGFAGIALAAGGVSVLTTALRDSVKEGTEAVKAHAQTVAALKSTGGAAGVTAKQIESLSTSISNQVGIDDEAIQSAENLLLTFTRVRNETGKGNDVFNRATKTIVDMSVAMKVPLKNASVLVGKALQDPIRGLTSLRRVGVSFTDQQRAQIAALVKSGRSMQAQKLILRELNREFGGSAKAAATPMQKLGVVVKNLEETVGRALLPAINKAAAALARFFTQMQTGRGAGGQFAATVTQVWKATKGVAVALGPAAKVLGAAFGPAARVARTAIGGMLQTIRGIVGVVKGVVSVAAHLIRGDFAGAWRAVKGIVRSALSGLGGLVKTLMAPVYTAVSGVVGRAIKSVGRLGAGIAGAIRGAVGTVGKAAGAVAGAILGAFRTLSRLIAGVWNGIVRIVTGAINTIKSAIGGIKSAFDKVTSIIPGRTGGVAHPGGFRRYQQGGLVPAMLSPGELVVHGGAGMVVPGQPAAADTVPMLLPVGAAVLTGDGQRRMAAGASVAQAVASQAPHFRTGGHVRGRVSWFGGPHDSQDSGRTALGLTTATPGVAIRPGDTWQTGRPTLGQYWRVRLRNGRSAVLRQTDLGPNQSTGRRIDLTYSALSRFGYREGNFPTDSIGVADLVGKGAAAGGAGTPGYSYRVSGLAQAQARRVGPSRTRQGLVSDAYQQGFDQGVAGLTRSRLAREPDTAYRAIAGAYRLPAARTVNVPGKPGGGGRPGGGGGSRRLVEASRPIRDTWAWARAIAAKFGLTISSSYRTPARNRAVGGVPNSWHIRGSARRPEAFDFSGSAQARARAQGWFRKFTHPDETLIHDAGSGMHLHVGGLYRRGGWVGAVGAARRYRTGTSRVQPRDPLPRYEPGAPMQVGPVVHQETTGPGIPAFGLRLKRALDQALTWAAGTLDKLNATIQQSADRKLGNLRGRLLRAIQRGGTEAQVKRLQAALSLIDKELGRRAGLIERRITQRQAASEQLGARGDIALRLAGTDPEGVAGLTARLGVAAAQGRMLWRTRSDLEKQLRFASLARNRAEIDRLRAALNDNMTAIIDSRVSQRELGRARDDARKSARLAFVAGLTQIQTDRVGLAQTGRQTLELQQRLAGTYDTGGQARADYITQNVIPALQAEREGLRLQGIEAMRQNNADLARQLRQAWEEKGNDILQAQLDAQEETARNTADTADALKNLGGTLSFEFQGSRLTDDLLASGVGA